MIVNASIVLLFAVILINSFGVSHCTGSYGRDFYIGILKTYTTTFYPAFSLLITSNMTGTATIYIPYLSMNTSRSFNQSLEYEVTGDTIAKLNTTVERKGIHVTTDVDVTIAVMKYPSDTWEGFLALPTTMLSTEYIISSIGTAHGYSYHSDFLVLAVHDNTSINITVDKNISTTKLNRLDTYLFSQFKDLSGAIVSTNKPIAVFSGHEAGTVGKNCNYMEYIVEQLLPTKHFAKEFIVPPLPPKSRFVVRVYSSEQNTSITLQNSTNRDVQLLLETGHFYEIISGADPMYVVTEKPVQVMLYSSEYCDGNNGDTFMSIVPAINQFRNSYHFTVTTYSSWFIHYLTVISKTEYVSGLRINGQQMGPTFSSIVTHANNISFTVNVYKLTSGAYHLSHLTGNTFGAIQYGFFGSTAYGYPLGIDVIKNKEKIEHEGLKCFDCKDMTHLYLCDTVTKCSNDQVCYVESYRSNSGQVKYKSGCLASKQCFNQTRQIGQTSSKCVHCCSSPLCNANGCGDNGLPAPSMRGPLCYNCSYVSSMDECTKVTLCAKDEVCSIEKYDRGGLYDQYTAKCHNKQCIFHKRELDHYVTSARKSRSAPVCKNCCNTDICNSNCTMTSQNGTDVIIVG